MFLHFARWRTRKWKAQGYYILQEFHQSYNTWIWKNIVMIFLCKPCNCKRLKMLPESMDRTTPRTLATPSHRSYCTSLTAMPESISAFTNLRHLETFSCNSHLKFTTSTGTKPKVHRLHLQVTPEYQASLVVNDKAWTGLPAFTLYDSGGFGSRRNKGNTPIIDTWRLDSLLRQSQNGHELGHKPKKRMNQ